METMKWSEVTAGNDQAGNGNNNGIQSPTIKNHSVTHFANYLYCFGGYDGRRNHMTLLLYSIPEQRWVRPHHVGNAAAANDDGAGDAMNAVVGGDNMDGGDARNNNPMQQHQDQDLLQANNDPMQQQQQLGQPQPYIPQNDYLAGDRSILVSGNPPPGRNGHSATLAKDPDDEDNARIIIIGGWLGTGPLAASDMHVLDISNAGRRLRWYQPPVKGTPPGPCNMHSADYVTARREVYVFRGGNGREYLNDLHALNVTTMVWRRVETTGEIPQQRANHSSAILEETGELFIFGGWNGTERLNDIHILDTETSNWTCPRAGGTLPHPRAGMTLTALRGRLYLFGGSGTSSKCFQDLQILDRETMSWLDVTQYEPISHGRHHENAYDNHYQQPNVNRQHNPPFPAQNYHGQQLPPHHMIDQSSSQDGQYQPPQYNFAEYDAGGPQSGSAPMDMGFSSTSSRADWRSRELAAHARSGTVSASPNPNDEDTVPTVLIHGRGPGRRAGHTATAVNRKIYVFGGSCGADYLNDFYVLDTDPPPTAVVTQPTSLNLIERRLGHFFNDEEFSDVTFIIQGRRVYGHKMVLAIVSDCFRAMFTAGFRESSSSEIEITGCSYDAFFAVMEYIYTVRYTGVHQNIISLTNNGNNNNNGNITPDRLGRVVEILELADRFFLDHLKEMCEAQLQPCVNADTVEYLLQAAQEANSMQLLAVCEHFIRNRDTRSNN